MNEASNLSHILDCPSQSSKASKTSAHVKGFRSLPCLFVCHFPSLGKLLTLVSPTLELHPTFFKVTRPEGALPN